jgi:hypothetical protein
MTFQQRRAAIVLAVAFATGCAVVLPLNRAVLGRFPSEIKEGLGMGTFLAHLLLAAAWERPEAAICPCYSGLIGSPSFANSCSPPGNRRR